jgi:hypothetical protein
MPNAAPHGFLRTAILIVLGVVVCAAFAPESAVARTRQGDRFGIRGGLWPQSEIIGTFDTRRIYPSGDSLRIGIDEEARILPYVEVFALFHLRGLWWVEGSIGWSGRNDVEVDGKYHRRPADIPVLLGNGRVDFFPMFVGARAVKQVGDELRPHNIYARGGGSIMFANESPELVKDSILKYGIYNSGTEGAFGFLAGVGAEYYTNETTALVADISYRYTKFSYAREAKFALSAFWFGVGITFKTR